MISYFPLLEIFFLISAIKTTDVDDVRDVLSYYRQSDDPIITFRDNQRKLQVIKVSSCQKCKQTAVIFHIIYGIGSL